MGERELRTKKYNAAERATKDERLKVARKSDMIRGCKMANQLVPSSKLNHQLGIWTKLGFDEGKMWATAMPYLSGPGSFLGTILLLSFGS